MSAYPDLAGKRVIITGASQGIGAAMVDAFLAEGSRVLGVARGPFERQAGGGFETLRCDIAEPGPLADWLSAAAARGEKADVLVNNAGLLRHGRLIDAAPADFDAMFAINVRATLVLSQLVARRMQAQGGGVIVNTGSYAATLASVGSGIYAATKAALVSLTRSMAAEWAPYGIRVNAFSPGVIPTRMTQPAIAAKREAMLEEISLRRLGTPEEVARVALFLASSASSYLAGVNIEVTGGKLVVQNPGSAWDGT